MVTQNQRRTDTPSRDRFLAKIVAGPNACAIWIGTLTSSGYGRFYFDGGPGVVAHRFAYELFVASIPAGLQVDHVCHNGDRSCFGGVCLHRRCVNPFHLEPVTPRENTLRSPHSTGSRYAAVTHCPQGHPYSGDNVRFRTDGRRRCAACYRARASASYYTAKTSKKDIET